MKYNYFGIFLIVVGLAALLISALADPIGIGGNPGFGWKQVVGVIVGGILMIVGLTQVTKEDSADEDSVGSTT